jgi:hypothetical protein
MSEKLAIHGGLRQSQPSPFDVSRLPGDSDEEKRQALEVLDRIIIGHLI